MLNLKDYKFLGNCIGVAGRYWPVASLRYEHLFRYFSILDFSDNLDALSNTGFSKQ